MLATIPSATILGARGLPVQVEVDVGGGLPGVTVAGLPDTACREGVHRLTAAIRHCGFDWPGSTHKIVVNLAPPGIRKLGSGLDCAIAVGILVANRQLPLAAASRHAFVGELGLDGTLRPVPGLVPMVAALADSGVVDVVVVPRAAHHEAVVAGGTGVRSVERLSDLRDHFEHGLPWPDPPPRAPDDAEPPVPDLADVRGQPVARRALEVAAAGGHHLLLVGPPGAGKTMLARRLPGILPSLGTADAVEVTTVWSAAGLRLPPTGLVTRPPFRAPHHGTSQAAVAGGGSAFLRPGEVSCAHRGVLFLDEMGEFNPAVLDALRTPLEEGVVRVARAREAVELPARFLLVGATNPCPCGEGGPVGSCRCSPQARARYLRRLSGPILDRFDLRVEVARPSSGELLGRARGEPTAPVAERVAAARAVARDRGVRCNADLPASALDEVAVPGEDAVRLLHVAVESGRLSARGLSRVRTVARTLADLDGVDAPVLGAEHVAAALALRQPLAGFDLRIAS